MKAAYVLVTPARNEGKYIARTIESVLAQTVLPNRWVIVSDGSTDDTDAIVDRYSRQHRLITLVRRTADASRNFGSKVRAIGKGTEQLSGVDYAFLGILDADVSFGPHYYERVLEEFGRNPRLGIAGGVIDQSHGNSFPVRAATIEQFVPGPIQLFRRQCYEQIGGFPPLRYGGEDTAAIEMARMHGWEVRSFSDLSVQHHRQMGTEGIGILRARFRHGLEDYCVGYHPLFEAGKCIRRLVEPPYVLGSTLRFTGYLWGAITRQKRDLPIELVRYIRNEQLKQLFGSRPPANQSRHAVREDRT